MSTRAAGQALDCDVLVIGGGAAGCVSARRLAELPARPRVVLVEAGPTDEGVEEVLDLSRIAEIWADRARFDWGYRAEPMARANPAMTAERARILGGCSSHNDCAFLRPPDSDFEAWEAAGAAGWGPRDLAPFFARVRERVNVEAPSSGNPVSEAFVEAGRQIGFADQAFDRGIADGVGWFPLNTKGKRRQSASVAYLHPIAKLPANLRVLTDTSVLRLTLEGGRATGAETTRGTIRARREVVLAAGAFNTPKLLMLSGIGPAEHVVVHGIPVLRHTPGVGAHLLDHVQSMLNLELKRPLPPVAVQYYEACLMATVEPGASAPDILFHFGLEDSSRYTAPLGYPGADHAVGLSPNVTRARSQGTVRLRSARAEDAPVIDHAYFTDPEGHDERVLLKGMKLGRRLAATPALKAVIKRELAPGPKVADDADLAAYMRGCASTVYHPCGTCRMGAPDDPAAVVDPNLRVRGVEGLRVADASIFPSIVTVNICNTVMMVGERAAALIAADLA